MSWDYIASRGFDVYLLDLRGYGKSTRPKEMSEDPQTNPPIVRGETALKDIGAVVDFILALRNIPRVNLIGWSWGTVTMATYTTQNPNKVERLILYAPGWIRQTASLVQAGPGPLSAYRKVTREQAMQRWRTGVPDDKKAASIPAGWFDAWADATWATDPEGAKANPPYIRAPNGVIQDSQDYWAAGKAYYDPAKITVPTLYLVEKYLGPKIPKGQRFDWRSQAASAIACITRSSHPAQNLKMRRLYASGSASFRPITEDMLRPHGIRL